MHHHWCQHQLRNYRTWCSKYRDVVVDTSDGTSMDDVTYAVNDHVDNQDYDDHTDDDHDNITDTYGQIAI